MSTYHMNLKFPIGKEVGEVSKDQFSARKCYVESIRLADALSLLNLDRPKGKEKHDKKLKVIEMDQGMLELQIQPGEELMPVELSLNMSGQTM